LAWAEEHDSLIVEDDYGSEFHFRSVPLPALASLDKTGRVVYIGAFSTVVTPALRVGYLVANPWLHERVVSLKRLTDAHLSWPMQQAMLVMLKEGHLDRHVRRMRGYYASKCRFLVELLAPLAPHVRVYGADAGVHLYLQCRSDLDLQGIKQAAYEQGIMVTIFKEYCIEKPERAGLFLGYGSLDQEHMMHGAKILVEILKQFIALLGSGK
jgi:GntR family transcriptional regulator/MocR family aminotransferase